MKLRRCLKSSEEGLLRGVLDGGGLLRVVS